MIKLSRTRVLVKRPDTVGLFNKVIRNPPLRPQKDGLTDFEFVTLANIIARAWLTHVNAVKDRKLRKSAYLIALKRDVPDEIKIVTTKAALLKDMSLVRTGPNTRAVSDALNRLLSSVPVIRHKRLEPPVFDFYNRDGLLHIVVNGQWIPQREYTYVALPLPLGTGSRALPLYLLIHKLDLQSGGRIRLVDLCKALGIPKTNNRRRALQQAVAAVNKHLALLWRDYFVAFETAGLPGGIKVSIHGEWVRFTAVNPTRSKDAQMSDEELEAAILAEHPSRQPVPAINEQPAPDDDDDDGDDGWEPGDDDDYDDDEPGESTYDRKFRRQLEQDDEDHHSLVRLRRQMQR